MKIKFPQCVCGHGWDYHIYGGDKCVAEGCDCQTFIDMADTYGRPKENNL